MEKLVEKVKAALKKLGIEEYLINGSKRSCAELYFIKKDLDMRRMVEEAELSVSVYRVEEKDGEKKRGAALATILPEMDEERIEKELSDAYFATQFAMNKYYDLVEGKKEEVKTADTKLAGMELADIALSFAKAVYASDTDKESFINTTEIFAARTEKIIINSAGVDVSYTENAVRGEFVVQCKEPEDVELYYSFDYTDLDTEALTKKAAKALETVKARAAAKTAPKTGKYDIILDGPQVSDLIEAYKTLSDSAYIYLGYSDYKKGDNLQGEDVKGDKLTVTLKPVAPYSGEGIKLEETDYLKEGKLLNILGGKRYADYLGIKPTGSGFLKYVASGKKTEEELKEKPYLYAVKFSDFQLDPFTGFFGGELRLAYLFDGEKVIPVTGGSISGNLFEAQKNFEFSKERYKDKWSDCPALVRIPNVDVAGC
ncbi:MAG: hypothetical protein K6B75_05235 [Lachnospiraceae bacterium]|nr:hypothetical protein [Lachnospiraceae bacterium]